MAVVNILLCAYGMITLEAHIDMQVKFETLRDRYKWHQMLPQGPEKVLASSYRATTAEQLSSALSYEPLVKG